MKEKTPEQIAHMRERQARNAKAWRERHPDRYKASRQAQDAKRAARKPPPKVKVPAEPKAKGGRPHKLPSDRPANIAIRERFLDWRDAKKGER